MSFHSFNEQILKRIIRFIVKCYNGFYFVEFPLLDIKDLSQTWVGVNDADRRIWYGLRLSKSSH